MKKYIILGLLKIVAKKVLLYTIIVIEVATLKAEVVERGI